MLEARGVGVDGILQEVSLTLAHGTVVGLMGPNGAGKSTLIRILAGIARPSRGEVFFEGSTLASLGRREVARRIAVVFQDAPPVVGFTARDVVAMGRFPHVDAWKGPRPDDAAAVDGALELAGIGALADRPHQMLSGGEKQLVQLARALAQTPRVLLMDEPAANLDPGHQRLLAGRLRELKARGMGILISTHDVAGVQRDCDRVMLMDRGSIVAEGTPSEVLTAERLKGIFG